MTSAVELFEVGREPEPGPSGLQTLADTMECRDGGRGRGMHAPDGGDSRADRS